MPTSATSCLGIVDWGIGGIGLVRTLDHEPRWRHKDTQLVSGARRTW